MKSVATQDEKPKSPIALSEVGITDLRMFLTVVRNGKTYRFVPSIDISVDLSHNLKGAHMSRLVETALEIIYDETHAHTSVEEMEIDFLTRLSKRHPYQTASIELSFDFAMERITPISKKKIMELYPIIVQTTKKGEDGILHKISVTSRGNTSCPHSKASTGKPHMQRAIGTISVIGTTKNIPTFEDLIEILEGSFSAETYSLLKTEDESFLVEKMYANPLFVEDVCRNILAGARSGFSGKDLEVEASVVSQESIHKHDVKARGKTHT